MNYELNKYFTVDLDEEVEQKNEEPSRYKVVMHNDDFTPMDFVVQILEKFFFMDRKQAVHVMMEVHLTGQGECGVYGRDTAETKIQQVVAYARSHEFPLACSMETV